ncbi:MAG: hypothetical protein WCK11_03140 [Candidatus Falkowbacteria bacterium]
MFDPTLPFLSDDETTDSDNQIIAGENQTTPPPTELLKADDNKLQLARKLLQNIRQNTDQLAHLLNLDEKILSQGTRTFFDQTKSDFHTDSQNEQNVVIGIFDGEKMIGPDGRTYLVSANYASKSKLVEGDALKLIITHNGNFIYKQTGPTERQRLVGKLYHPSENEFAVKVGEQSWRVLTASVTYFKGEFDDEAVIMVPKNGTSKWAAVEHIVKKGHDLPFESSVPDSFLA